MSCVKEIYEDFLLENGYSQNDILNMDMSDITDRYMEAMSSISEPLSKSKKLESKILVTFI